MMYVPVVKNKTPHTATGKVRYKNDWVVIDCPFDIVYYYNRVCNWMLHKQNKITWPLHGAHITVVAGKYTKVKKNWGYRADETVKFNYGTLTNNDNYFWLVVDCPEASEIREKLGLSPEPKWPYHLTVGYLNE